MSEDERKAIEKLSAKKNESTWNDTIRQIKREEIKDVVVTRQKYITTVLNLIEKQQKELEQEKEKNKELEEKLKMSIAIKGTYPETEKGANDFDNYFISKDKIRDFIKKETFEGTYNVILAKRLKELLEEE
jgi:predicted transcriptional regulator